MLWVEHISRCRFSLDCYPNSLRLLHSRGNPLLCFFKWCSLSMSLCVRVQRCVFCSGFKIPTCLPELCLSFRVQPRADFRWLALLLASLPLTVQNSTVDKNSGLEPDCLALKSSSATSLAVILDCLRHFSMQKFPHGTYLLRLLWGLNDLIRAQRLEQCLASSKGAKC